MLHHIFVIGLIDDNILFFVQLNDVLIPNPFKRPRAVFLLEVNGINGLWPWINYNNQILYWFSLS